MGKKLLLVVLFLLLRFEAALDANSGQGLFAMGRGKENQPNALPERSSCRIKRSKVDSDFLFAPIGLSERHSKAAQGRAGRKPGPRVSQRPGPELPLVLKSILTLDQTETYRCQRGRIQPSTRSEAAAAPLPRPPTS